MQVSSGLYHAHSKCDEHGANLGIIHRDVSPHNVLVSYDGEVKVIDFGVAKASIKMTHTMSGIIKGKLLYMSPEQAMAKELDARSDLFAVGLILYKMTTSRLPFEGENEFQVYNKLVAGKVTAPRKLNSAIPEPLDKIMLKALAKKPAARPADAMGLRNELAQLLQGLDPGYTSSRLARFMETYFPPRPLSNPAPSPEPPEVDLNGAAPQQGGTPPSHPGGPPPVPGQPVNGSSSPAIPPPVSDSQPKPPPPPPIPGSGPRPTPAPPPPPPVAIGAPGTPPGGAPQPIPPPISDPLLNSDPSAPTVPVKHPLPQSPDGQIPGPDEATTIVPSFPDFPAEAYQAETVPVSPVDIAPRSRVLKFLVIGVVFVLLLVIGVAGGYLFLGEGEAVDPPAGEEAVESPADATGPDTSGTASADAAPPAEAKAAPEEKPEAKAAASDGEREPGDGEILVELAAKPAKVRVYLGDELVATTPARLILKSKAGAKRKYVFRKKGYRSAKRWVRMDRSSTMKVKLKKKRR